MIPGAEGGLTDVDVDTGMARTLGLLAIIGAVIGFFKWVKRVVVSGALREKLLRDMHEQVNPEGGPPLGDQVRSIDARLSALERHFDETMLEQKELMDELLEHLRRARERDVPPQQPHHWFRR